MTETIDKTISPYVLSLQSLKQQPSHKLKEVGDQWRTPAPLWWGINSMFGPFVLDLFADRDNAKCEAFYTAEDNALIQNWSERLDTLNGAAYANPPYSRASKHEDEYITGMRHIMAHTLAMREAGGRYVFLIKAATAEVWWPEDADHVAFIRGRISFDLPTWYRPAEGEPSESSAGFGAAIAVFDKDWRGPKLDYVSRNHLEARGATFMRQIELAAQRLLPQISPLNIPEIIPAAETESRVWPAEVSFLFDQVPDAAVLAEPLQLKIKHHINRLKLDGLPTAEIITTVVGLVESMGATA